MKTCTIWTLTLCLCLLAACGAPVQEELPSGGTAPAVQTLDRAGDTPAGESVGPGQPEPSLAEDEVPSQFTCRIVDIAENGSLLLAELDGGPYGGNGVFRLSNPDTAQISLDGQPIYASGLQDGMTVNIVYNGFIQETFPAQLPEVYKIQAETAGGACFDLCGLYLQVLDDLWQRDAGLNENVSQAALDLAGAPGGLTPSEQAALIWRFGELHGVEAFAATYDQLLEDGYITKPSAEEDGPFCEWKDGCLLSIKPNESLDGEICSLPTYDGEICSLPTLFFNAEKWRSSLGAYYFHDCSATWPQAGTWTGYTIGGEMIS